MSEFFHRTRVQVYNDDKYPYLTVYASEGSLSVEVPTVLVNRYHQAEEELERAAKLITDYIEAHREADPAAPGPSAGAGDLDPAREVAG